MSNTLIKRRRGRLAQRLEAPGNRIQPATRPVRTSSSSNKVRQLTFLRPAILSIAGAALALMLANPEYPQFRIFPVLGLAFCLFPFFCFQQTRDLKHIPVFIVSFFTWIYFCAPFLYEEFPARDIRRTIPVEHLTELALYPALSILALICGYYALPESSRRIFDSRQRLPLATLQQWSIWLCVVGCVYMVIGRVIPDVIASLGQTVAILNNLALFGCLMALICHLRGGLKLKVVACAGAALLLQVMVILSSTLFARVAYIMVCIFMVILLERRRIPWKLAILLLLLSLPLMANRYTHRSDLEVEQTDSIEQSLPEKIENAIKMVSSDFSGWNWADTGDVIRYNLSTRLENISFLGQCVFLHTEGKPFKHGETMVGLFYSVIPRFLFPWKPKQDQGEVLSAEYGFKDPGPECAINFPWLADLYINFGFPGMVLGSLLFGVFFRWACSLAAYGSGDLNMLVFCELTWWLFLEESNVSMVSGGILQCLVVWWLLSKLLKSQLNSARVVPALR